jgi:Zn finger protein HypA/HybF involved in hydrogenase expression
MDIGIIEMVKKVIQLKCKVCDYKWIAMKEDPVCCPRCHSYRWNGFCLSKNEGGKTK